MAFPSFKLSAWTTEVLSHNKCHRLPLMLQVQLTGQEHRNGLEPEWMDPRTQQTNGA